MATTFDLQFPLERNGLHLTGLFKRAKTDSGTLPLVVLIHGGGANAAYFDNSGYSCVFPLDFHAKLSI